MKKPIIAACGLFLILIFSACSTAHKSDSSENADLFSDAASIADITEGVTSTETTKETAEETVLQTTAATAATVATVATEEPTIPSLEETASTTKVSPTNTAKMYSSYAFMVSYDPATGWADFDYFDALKGDAAVQWLVDNEGYSLSDAQALVDDFADSEFITKNVNPQLRTVDLSVTPLKLMYYTDGSLVPGPDPVVSSYADLNTIYSLNSTLILHSCWYSITVTDGIVTAVDQLYWP